MTGAPSASSRRGFLRSTLALGVAALASGCRALDARAPQGKLTLFMIWDMEGTSGLFNRPQAWFDEPGVKPEVAAEGIALLIADVNSASAAALAAGADRLIVCDTHLGGGNFRPNDMLADPRITYLYKSLGYQGSSFRWLPGLDETVDGLMLMGHHAKAGTPHAFLPHTDNMDWADFSINGRSVGEVGLAACFAGHWGVPLVLAQGDEAMCTEVEAQFPGTVTACVKRAESFDRATGPDAKTARRLTAEKVTEAIRKLRIARPAPYRPALPMRVAVRFTSVGAADAAATRPGVRRIDAYTVQRDLTRQCDVIKWLTGIGVGPEVASR